MSGFSRAIQKLTSNNSSVTITDPSGPVTDLAAAGGGGGITALTGDVTASGSGSVAATLATVSTAQTIGDAAHVPAVTTDVKGRVTGMVSTLISIVSSQVSDLTTTLSAYLAKTGGTMTGAIAMGANKITGLANGSAAQDAAAFGQIPTALPPNGAAGGDLAGTYPNPTLSGTTNVESIIAAAPLVAGAAQKTATPGGDLAGVGSTIATPLLTAVTTAETVGDATHYPIVTTDAKGRVTGMIAQAVAAGALTHNDAINGSGVTLVTAVAQTDSSASLTPGVWMLIFSGVIVNSTATASTGVLEAQTSPSGGTATYSNLGMPFTLATLYAGSDDNGGAGLNLTILVNVTVAGTVNFVTTPTISGTWVPVLYRDITAVKIA